MRTPYSLVHSRTAGSTRGRYLHHSFNGRTVIIWQAVFRGKYLIFGYSGFIKNFTEFLHPSFGFVQPLLRIGMPAIAPFVNTKFL